MKPCGDVTACFFVLSKNNISEAARLITHLQDMSSITDTFEEICLKFPKHDLRLLFLSP